MREGRDATIVALGSAVPHALTVAADFAREGIELEVVDLRSLRPWDPETVLASLRRTNRLVIVHEAWTTGGFGAEIAATVAERGLAYVDSPVVRVGAKPVPIPSGKLRRCALPDRAEIAAAVRRVLDGEIID
jgi:pyruvate/2-oxoglutarate/acetoin dehydrogenase E1 component